MSCLRTTLSRRGFVAAVAGAASPAGGLCASLVGRNAGWLDGGTGTRVYFTEEGTGPPVLLLHSAFTHGGVWEPNVPALARRFRVVRFDARGHGRTSLAPRAPIGADDILRVMDGLELRSASLVGSSMGGTCAFDFAVLHPGRVDRLVMVGSTPAGGYEPEPESVTALARVFERAASAGHAAGVEAWLDHPMNAALDRRARDFVRRVSLGSPAMFSIGGFDAWPVRFAYPRSMTRLSEVTAPVLFVIGKRDMPSLRRSARMAAAGVGSGRVVELPDVGHFPALERPQVFNTLLASFLARQG